MPVRQHNAPDFTYILLHKSKVRDNQIHSQHIGIREAVNNKHILTALIQCHVLPDLTQSAQRNNPNRCFFHCSSSRWLPHIADITGIFSHCCFCRGSCFCCGFRHFGAASPGIATVSFRFFGSLFFFHLSALRFFCTLLLFRGSRFALLRFCTFFLCRRPFFIHRRFFGSCSGSLILLLVFLCFFLVCHVMTSLILF